MIRKYTRRGTDSTSPQATHLFLGHLKAFAEGQQRRGEHIVVHEAHLVHGLERRRHRSGAANFSSAASPFSLEAELTHERGIVHPFWIQPMLCLRAALPESRSLAQVLDRSKSFNLLVVQEENFNIVSNGDNFCPMPALSLGCEAGGIRERSETNFQEPQVLEESLFFLFSPG